MADNKGKLFEYAVLFHPDARKVGEEWVTDPSQLIVEPKRVVARDDKAVAIQASRDIPDTYLDKLDKVEVIVRPF